MIAYCGLDCEQCEASVATQNNDDALRAKVAEAWTKLFGAPLRPEDINCTGCHSEGVKMYYCDQLCEIRKCATKKSVPTCADCADYVCATLDEVLRMAPEAKVNLDALRSS